MQDDTATPEAAPASQGIDAVTDRLAGLLGGGDDTIATTKPEEPARAATPEGEAEPTEATPESETTEPEQDQPKDPQTPSYRVKVNGADVDVPLPELLRGYSRTEDYKAKTTEAAETRKAAEAELAAAKADRERYAQSLAQVMSFAQQMDPILAEGSQTDWAKLAIDSPMDYVQRRAIFDQRAEQFRAFQREQERLSHEANARMGAAEREALVKAMPEIADTAKAKAVLGEIAEDLAARGFSSQEIGAVLDHRQVLVARDAMRWRKHEAEQKKLGEKKVPEPAPKTLKPSAASSKPSETARIKALRARARQTGRIDDQAASILARLDSSE